jgi:pantoate--beta-alanine ligase
MAITIDTIARMQLAADTLRREGKRVAVVPTMGALHEGHLSLIRLAKKHADVVVATVFVNPLQFGPGEDFERYPRSFQRDILAAVDAGADYVFAPSSAEMYPPDFQTSVQVERLTGLLEGAVRPGHFRGVTTVVAKLFHAVKPHVAVFGQKDAQQLAVIRRMVADLAFHVDIVIGPTVRESDGLAMSSRNAYLSPSDRKEAPVLHQALTLARDRIQQGEFRRSTLVEEMRALITARSSGKIEYLSVANAATLEEVEQVTPGKDVIVSLAVRFGETRLIDNIPVRP